MTSARGPGRSVGGRMGRIGGTLVFTGEHQSPTDVAGWLLAGGYGGYSRVPAVSSGTGVTGVPVVAVRSASSAVSRVVTGPGLPLPMTRPSISSTGAIPPIVPVTKTS